MGPWGLSSKQAWLPVLQNIETKNIIFTFPLGIFNQYKSLISLNCIQNLREGSHQKHENRSPELEKIFANDLSDKGLK